MENQDNQQNREFPLDDAWLDEILKETDNTPLPAEPSASIPSADSSADEDIEQLIAETMSQIMESKEEPVPVDATQSFAQPTIEPELPVDEITVDSPVEDIEQFIAETLTQIQVPAPESATATNEATQVIEQPVFKDEEYRDAFGDGEELESFFDEEAPAKKKRLSRKENKRPVPSDKLEAFPGMEEEPTEEPPARKKRPRRKGKDNLFGLSHLLATCVWLVIIVFIGVTLANVLWVCASDVLAFGRESREASITIEDSDTIEDISQKLQQAGLIRYPNLFSLYAQFTGAREDISSGTFALNTIYDYHALVNFMNADSAEREVVEVLIPEGYNCYQLFALLEEKGVCKATDLELYAATGELDEYWFLEDVQRGSVNCLEGFLYPDTYQFYINDNPRRVLEKMLDNFSYRFTDEMRNALIQLNRRLVDWMEDEGYGEDYIEEHQLTLRELVTIASLVEEETANTLESYTISSVIYNRLYRWGGTPSFLNIDAAIIYALGEHKEELTYDDLQIDSPYNTYKYTGLTPGPISNPGLTSLNAALEPDDTDYYYYALDPDTGAHHFSESEYEHNEFLESLEDD